ncbi:MAG: FAD-dependent oxidoreductase [Ruminococcaceae bacterium]|nr:FAD-dependent oxidoreductase [Oscillospiraceae bacterium]
MNRKHIWDVVVIGGGVSGCMAAFAAAKQGASTLLIEQYGFLGGALTNAGVGPMMTFHAGERQVVTGLPQELIDRLCEKKGCIGHIEDTIGYASSVTPFDAEVMKRVLDEMAHDYGVEVLFHAVISGVKKEQDSISSVSVVTRGGMLEIAGKILIDATGDAALSFLAGADICQGRDSDGLCQPMTTNLKVANVDMEALRNEIKAHPENFIIPDVSSIDRTERLSVAGFFREFNRAKEEGIITTQRENVLFFETVNPGEVIVNTTRVIQLDPVNPWDLSKAECEGRKQAEELMHFFRSSCKGFSDAVLLSTGVQIGVRESRRVMGDYLLTAEDLLSSKHFEDTVALGGYPIDIHNPTGAQTATTHLQPGQFYDIPLRSLLVKGFDNLMVCGRCLSATHEASAAVRVTPIAMATGQAAGAAAGLSAMAGIQVRELAYQKLLQALTELGATLQ